MVDKLPQTQAELEEHLSEHIYFLEASAAAFDAGYESEAKRLAVSLRVLLHDTPNSKSLLGQLGKRNFQFYDTASKFDPINLLSYGGLIAVYVSPTGAKYIPFLDDSPDGTTRKVDFDTWWNASVFVDSKRQSLSRRDLVLTIADQDGGAHVDPKLNEVYARLSRYDSLGWLYVNPSGRQSIGGPERAAIRQIAHEVLKTLKPEYLKVTPTLPEDGGVLAGFKVEEVVPKPQRPKVGRNDPCPCGSGKKYKRCCGKAAC